MRVWGPRPAETVVALPSWPRVTVDQCPATGNKKIGQMWENSNKNKKGKSNQRKVTAAASQAPTLQKGEAIILVMIERDRTMGNQQGGAGPEPDR
jgi:hypothetical protein